MEQSVALDKESNFGSVQQLKTPKLTLKEFKSSNYLHPQNYQKNKINNFTVSPPYEIFMTILTFVVLYADDFRAVIINKVTSPIIYNINQDQDIYYYSVMLAAFWIFFIEIIVLSVVRPGYMQSFNFYMDIVSTFSTLIDIPIVMYTWFGIDLTGGDSYTKASKATKMSTRASKVIRILRLIRLVRIAKLYRYGYRQIEIKFLAYKNSRIDEKIPIPEKKIEWIFSEKDPIISSENHQVMLYNYKMVPKPKYGSSEFSNQSKPFHNLGEDYILSAKVNQQQTQLLRQSPKMSVQKDLKERFQRFSTVKVALNRQSIQIENKFNEIQNELPMKDPEFQSNQIFYYQECNEYFENDNIQNLGNIITEEQTKQLKPSITKKETKVGSKLSDLTTKRCIMVMFSIMLSIPLLDIETYFTPPDGYSSSVGTVANFQNTIFLNNQSYQNLIYQGVTQFMNSQGISVLELVIGEQTIFHKPRMDTLRNTEIISYATDICSIITDNKANSDLNSILGIVRTTFVIIILVGGAIQFSNDAYNQIVMPIESMLEKVRRIIEHPLEVAQIEEEIVLAEENMGKEHSKKRQKNQRDKDETFVLENLIVKTGALLAIGFGQAGAEIIAQNLKHQEFNPLIPGKKIFAIWGFCDIRNFIDMTELLEESVMVFVNEVALIVHSTVHKYEGAVNKNIGDAFLLVWKFPENVLVYHDDKPQINDMRMVNNYADMALISFLKVLFKVRLSKRIGVYCERAEVQGRLPGFSIKMGFGLHVGWAIEGAIGSEYKIDASYLSPNVNMASRLEAATKQYGVFILCSGVFYRLLSKDSQNRLRHVDRCTVKGSIQPLDFFTFDVDLQKITDEYYKYEKVLQGRNKKLKQYQKRQKHQKRLQKMYKNNFNIYQLYNTHDLFALVQLKYTEQFMNIFHDGVNSYLGGQWKNAKKQFNITKNMIDPPDGPSLNLLNFMSKYQFVSPKEWRGYRDLLEK